MASHRDSAAAALSGEAPQSQQQHSGKENLFLSGPFAPDTSSSSSHPKSLRTPRTPRTPVSPLQPRDAHSGRVSTKDASSSAIDIAQFLSTTAPPSDPLPVSSAGTKGKGLGGHVRTRSSGGKNRLVKRALRGSGKGNGGVGQGSDNGTLAHKVPRGVEQRIASNGKRYLHITAGEFPALESAAIQDNSTTNTAPIGAPADFFNASRPASQPLTTSQASTNMAPPPTYARPASSHYSAHSRTSHDGTSFPRSSNSTSKRGSRNAGLGLNGNSTSSKRESQLGNMFSSLRERRSMRSQGSTGERISGGFTQGDDGTMPAAKARTTSNKSSRETLSSNFGDPLKSHPTNVQNITVEAPSHTLPTVPASPASPTALPTMNGNGKATSISNGDTTINGTNTATGPPPSSQPQRVSRFANPYIHHPTPKTGKSISLQEFLRQTPSFDGAMPKWDNRLQPGPAPAVTQQMAREQQEQQQQERNVNTGTNGTNGTNGTAAAHKAFTATNGSTYASASASRNASRNASPTRVQNLSSRSSINGGAASERRERTRARKLRDLHAGSAGSAGGLREERAQRERASAVRLAGERVLAPSPSFAAEGAGKVEDDVVKGRAELGTDGGLPTPTATASHNDTPGIDEHGQHALIAGGFHGPDQAERVTIEQTPETSPLSFKDRTPHSASGSGGALRFSNLKVGSDVPQTTSKSVSTAREVGDMYEYGHGHQLPGDHEADIDTARQEADVTPTQLANETFATPFETPLAEELPAHDYDMSPPQHSTDAGTQEQATADSPTTKFSPLLTRHQRGETHTHTHTRSTSSSNTMGAGTDPSHAHAYAAIDDNLTSTSTTRPHLPRNRSSNNSPPQPQPQTIPTHLTARLEHLERENRLLEAALMAVLKTSGKLNACPCLGEFGSRDSTGTSRVEGASTSSRPARLIGNARALEEEVAVLARFRDDRLLAGGAGVRNSDSGSRSRERERERESTGSWGLDGRSALDVYLATRAAGSRGAGGR